MFTITCAKTGIEFQTESKRQKNHPLVSAFLDESNRDGRRYTGAYAKASELLTEAKGQFDNIEDLMTAVREAYTAWQNGEAKPVIRKTAGYYIHQQKVASRQRDAINAVLKQHGYRWEKDEYGTEDEFLPGSYGAGIGEYAGFRWQLVAPDGRNVTIQQAFREIGQEIPE